MAKSRPRKAAKGAGGAKAGGKRAGADGHGTDVTAEFEKALAKTKPDEKYVLRLYVTGSTPRSAAAIATIRELCDRYLKDRCDLEVVDVYQQPARAQGDQVIAAPTLVKKLPMPLKKLVGDLSDEERVLAGLDLRVKRDAGGDGK
ncbi:MAG TPA: circadian clock KaiB family protein [Phycisphaerae bacterium]|nr:circadian clock KaiB family protein [Phycisphaerae bacterium]